MLIVDSQIHLWQKGKMSAHHRQIPTYSVDDALAEMASAGVDCAVIHPPSSLGEAVNVLAVEAVRQHPDKFCILGHFDLESPDREKIVARWRDRPGMLGFRFTFNQPHQKAWWTDGSLDWFWAACQKAGLPVGLLAGGNIAALKKIAERHPGTPWLSVGDISTKIATQGGARIAFAVPLIGGYVLGTAMLQLGYQRGGALTVAGIASLLTNSH